MLPVLDSVIAGSRWGVFSEGRNSTTFNVTVNVILLWLYVMHMKQRPVN